MPTYNIKLDINICAPNQEDAIRQLPAYARNHATISTSPIAIRHSAGLSSGISAELSSPAMCPECGSKATWSNSCGLLQCDNCGYEEDGEYKEDDDSDGCEHIDNITYGKLIQIDGCPQYEVKCETCGKLGIIYLIEGDEDWECRNKKLIH